MGPSGLANTAWPVRVDSRKQRQDEGERVPYKTKAATATDFSNVMAKPNDQLVMPTNSEKIHGMSTLGVSISRINYALGGLNPPRTRPLAGLIFILYGTLDVGFVAMMFFRVTCELPDGVLTKAFQIPNKEIETQSPGIPRFSCEDKKQQELED
ncbi:germin-like protein 5-1 [Miscanthus floridulus]|uniref:germin-like protein 5-1 n=1 Tax=Miscanthus floridulus TaxID=154761 RepID=UPI00345B0EF9